MAQVAAQSSNMDGASATTDAPVVSARILKKRETDRKCQRMIRERTKSRIAYLEGLVEQFREQDSSGRLETMMKQLTDVKEERDTLVKKVKTIESIISGSSLKEDPDARDPTTIKVRSDSEDDAPLSVSSHHTVPQQSQSPRNEDLISNSNSNSNSQETLASSYVLHNKQFAAYLDSPLCTTTWSASSLQASPQPACECSIPSSAANPVANPASPIGPVNRWRYANDTLSEWFKWSPQALDMRDYFAYNDDVLVRVVVEGWDAAEQHGHMHPLWRLLRGIDEMIFTGQDVRERLGTLHLMGWLLLAHVNPTREQHMKLPSFYLKRPSRDMLHAYATEFFAWPGLRERFVYSEHRYCSTTFWRLYVQNLRLQWPYEFRDCYTYNTDTGLYNISPTFRERISDIRAWTMGMEMFKQYPELYSDIPAWNHIPTSLSSTSATSSRRQSRKALPLPPSSKVQETDDKGKAPIRRGSHVRLAQQLQMMPASLTERDINLSQSFNHYQSSNHSPRDMSGSTVSPAFEYAPSNIVTTGADMPSGQPMAVWGYNDNLDAFHPNPV